MEDNTMINIVIPTTPERVDRCNELIKSIQENTHDVEYRIIVFPNNLGGWVPAVLRAIEDLHPCIPVWLLGSDCIVENNAVKILYDKWLEDDTKILEPFNELHGGALCQHPFTQPGNIEKYLDSRFTHWFSDNWFDDQARRDGKLVYVPEAKIEHRHFINGKAPRDKTYETIFNPGTIEKDRLLYEKLKKTL